MKARRIAKKNREWVDYIERGRKVLQISPDGDIVELRAFPLRVKLGEMWGG